MKRKRKKKIVYVNVDELIENPMNAKLFGDLPANRYEGLKRNIQKNGICTPFEITSEKMLLGGHARLKICKEQGITSVPCIYRRDLVTEEDQVERLISDNIHRRQQSDEEIVKIGAWYKAKYPCKHGGDRRSEVFQEGQVSPLKGKASDWIGQQMNISGRTYLRAKSRLKKKLAGEGVQTQMRMTPDGEISLNPKETKQFKVEDFPKLVTLSKGVNPEIPEEITPSSTCYLTEDEIMAVIPKSSELEDLLKQRYQAETRKFSGMEAMAEVCLSARYLRIANEMGKLADLLVLKVVPAGVLLENEFMAVIVARKEKEEA